MSSPLFILSLCSFLSCLPTATPTSICPLKQLQGSRADTQDLEGGGIGDRPGDWVDVFHTIFGVAGMSPIYHPMSPVSQLSFQIVSIKIKTKIETR